MGTFDKRNLVFSTLLLVAAVIWISAFASEARLERQVEAYLVNERQYSVEDIDYMKASFGMSPMIGVEVHFKDDPDARYFYTRNDGMITQYNAGPRDGIDLHHSYAYKHKEEEIEAREHIPVQLAMK
ncbi:DUF3139 domain-containing protein [Paenibacillus hunanensis]|uniref:DUF3139 domain-containing protein n=1 Tax=Paenibacillus hunanensis TaxID=539262 RepID=UPI002A6A0333|nr:DUF3139 domain-containing protein [Paenibacillus hunanensis]WPP43261.1 DUF3139 domain-containing protein [Paenibacillus hunanensis]